MPSAHFLEHAFRLTPDGRLLYPEQIYSCPKKSRVRPRSAPSARLTMLLLFGGSYPEGDVLRERSGAGARSCLHHDPAHLSNARHCCATSPKITESKITFPELNATITAIPSNFAGAAGGNQNIVVFDEFWAYVSERSVAGCGMRWSRRRRARSASG